MMKNFIPQKDRREQKDSRPLKLGVPNEIDFVARWPAASPKSKASDAAILIYEC